MDPGMKLNGLGMCVGRNAGGITSGTVEDAVQNAAGLKAARERITFGCEKTCLFSAAGPTTGWESALTI